jgi:hypothetical protein
VLVAFLAHKADFFVSNLLITTSRFPKKERLIFWHVGLRNTWFHIISTEVFMGAAETRHDLWLKRINT